MIGMARYPDKFFDLAIVDPPYGIGMDIISETKPIKNSKYNKGKGIRKGYSIKWDKRPSCEYFNELFRVSINQIIWGGNYFINDLYDTRCILIWDKISTGFSGADFELAWTSFINQSSKIFRMSRVTANHVIPGDWRSSLGDKIHPTQKPVSLYKWILKNYAKPGYKILDTHLGSGSSRIAAYKAGLDFYGWEIDKDYFDAMEKRFKNHINQLTLSL